MYTLTQSQAFWPSLSFLLFFTIFIIASLRIFRLRREDADEWAKMVLDPKDQNQKSE